MRLAALVVAGLCTLLPACAPKPVAVTPAAPQPPSPTSRERLDAADRLFRAGCLNCLEEALQAYDALRAAPEVAGPATSGAVRAAALITLRERGLGMSDSGRLDRARALVDADADLQATFRELLAIVDAAPRRLGRVITTSDLAVDEGRRRAIQQNRLRWMEMLRATADQDPFLATLWVSFSCANSLTNEGRTKDGLLAPLTAQRSEPLVVFEAATCGSLDVEALEGLVAADPRFKEADYWFGYRYLRGRLDDAQLAFVRAYEWHPQWPGTTLALAGLFMTAEELEPAYDFYNGTLGLLPGLVDALVGRVRALSYMGRYDEAIARVNEFIESQPADGYYWRAWNKNQQHKLDEAWADIQRSEKLWSNSEVAKLAGVIAYQMKNLEKNLEIARDRFEKASKLNPDDCESHFYLGTVHADLRSWTPSATSYVTSVSCFTEARASLVEQIADIQTSSRSPERKARQVASREEKIVTTDRLVRNSWFNIAAAYFNLGRLPEAATFAEKVVDEDQYRERAQTILGAQKPRERER